MRIGILLGIALLTSSCDWIFFHYVNSVPVHGKTGRNPVVHVFLGIDGLPYSSLKEAQARGAFSEPSWKAAKFITAFPGTSDTSWTRILRTEKMGGYEYQYYDPTSDKIVNEGLKGLAMHVTPPVIKSFVKEPRYYDAFDFRGNSYFYSANAYRNIWTSYADNLDNLFFLLAGRSQTIQVFSAYMLEIDVLGHLERKEDVTQAVIQLSDRIRKFKRSHPERQFVFTIVSDHGNDFVHVPDSNLVQFDREMAKQGINPVKSLTGHDPAREIYAIPIQHTRVTYVSLHTHPQLVQEVARLASKSETVDLALSKANASDLSVRDPVTEKPLPWYTIWKEGELQVSFGFDEAKDEYRLLASNNYKSIDVALNFSEKEIYRKFSGRELFELTKNSKYPDIFYRTRTALSPVGIDHPGDVLVSFKHPYASLGFELPGAANVAVNSGFHGAIDDLGTLGVLITEEKPLPDAVRADNFLELFPLMKKHIQDRGVQVIEGDRNSRMD